MLRIRRLHLLSHICINVSHSYNQLHVWSNLRRIMSAALASTAAATFNTYFCCCCCFVSVSVIYVAFLGYHTVSHRKRGRNWHFGFNWPFCFIYRIGSISLEFNWLDIESSKRNAIRTYPLNFQSIIRCNMRSFRCPTERVINYNRMF